MRSTLKVRVSLILQISILTSLSVCTYAQNRLSGGVGISLGNINWSESYSTFGTSTGIAPLRDGSFDGLGTNMVIQTWVQYKIKKWLVGPRFSYHEFRIGELIYNNENGSFPNITNRSAIEKTYALGIKINRIFYVKDILQITPMVESGILIFDKEMDYFERKWFYGFGLGVQKELGRWVPSLQVQYQAISFDFPDIKMTGGLTFVQDVRASGINFGLGCAYKFR